MNKLQFIKALQSPLKPFKLKFYFGKISIGVPYFFPRRTVKDPDKPGYLKFVDKKFGIDIVPLGWKTKWSSTDYRLEWEPRISFVFWKWQFVIFFNAPDSNHYWPIWLYYHNDTDKTKSIKERIEQCQVEYPQIWERSQNGKKETINYYDYVLKDKWKKKPLDEVRDKKLDKILK